MGVEGGLGCYFFAVLADVVGGDVGVELADGGEAYVSHDGVAELGGEDGEAGGSVGVIVLGDDLGEDLAAEVGEVGSLIAIVVACDGLAADDVEDALGMEWPLPRG